ncbi:MAG: glutamate--tRNA ligase [Coriobacteriales bacterium]|jgi:glutamyl-tRNA synthetase|nr:glutamate--tRNA ligase [Coriobacteriales bacterium]
MSDQIRVRFAPSPTGYLHVGGARTAIYNWAFARAHGGKFLLRIEDTDAQRSTPENTQQILRSLAWLGLDWDEGPTLDGSSRGDFGPYLQTERAELYEREFKKLQDAGLVYPEGDSAAWRFDVRRAWPERTIEFDDLVFGHIVVERDQVEDFIIKRSDGSPIYHFAVVVDDANMLISHVIRGDDHLSNTPKQIVLYRALGYRIPEFAHLSMILGDDGKRLSKRHGATSVEAYRGEGYLPEAMVNYLALLGWAPDGKTTLFARETLAAKFKLDHVSKNPATFDAKKLNWVNQQYIKQMGASAFVDAWWPYLIKAADAEDWQLPDPSARREWYEAMYALVCERIDTLAEAAPKLAYFFSGDHLAMDERSVQKVLRGGGGDNAAANAAAAKNALEAQKAALAALGSADWTLEPITAALDDALAKLALKPKLFWQPLRVAVCGNMVSPPLNESIALLDRVLVLTRIERALQLVD